MSSEEKEIDQELPTPAPSRFDEDNEKNQPTSVLNPSTSVRDEPPIAINTGKWSWSSWLMGAPPMNVEPEMITTPPQELQLDRCNQDETEGNEEIATPKDLNQSTSFFSSNNWIWNATALFPKNEESQAAPTTSGEETTSTATGEETEKKKSLTSRLWGQDLWSNVKKDLSEFAHVMQEDTQQIINSTTAGMKATQQLSSTFHKLTNSQLARKIGEIGEKTLLSVGSFILTEEEMNMAMNEESEMSYAQMANVHCSSDRVKRQLATLLAEPSRVFELQAEQMADYEAWIESLAPQSGSEYVESQSGELGDMLLAHSAVRHEYSRLVPNQLTHDQFFLRYLFCKATLESAEQRREILKARAEKVEDRNREESWGSDSGEEEETEAAVGDKDKKSISPTTLVDNVEEHSHSSNNDVDDLLMENIPPGKTSRKNSENVICVDRGDLVMVRHEDSVTNDTSNSAGSSTVSSDQNNENIDNLHTSTPPPNADADAASWDGEDLTKETLTEEERLLAQEFKDSEDDWENWS